MDRIIECVPNYSEGRNKEIIDQIVAAVADTKVVTERGEESVKVLDVDPGEATNRTVVTFVGSPEAVLEAAFQGEKKAAELRLVGRSLITVARDAEFIVDALGKSSGKLSAFLKSDTGNRYERKHISSS